MTPLFKPDDFEDESINAENFMKVAASIANNILQRELDKAPVVYGCDNSWGIHRARLMFIEEIKKEPCVHHPRGNTWEGFNPLECNEKSEREAFKAGFDAAMALQDERALKTMDLLRQLALIGGVQDIADDYIAAYKKD